MIGADHQFPKYKEMAYHCGDLAEELMGFIGLYIDSDARQLHPVVYEYIRYIPWCGLWKGSVAGEFPVKVDHNNQSLVTKRRFL